jgi:hypothetical protein
VPTNKTLREFWATRVRIWRGASVPKVDPVLHYRDLAVSGLDYAGQISSVFNSDGVQGTISVTPNFGNLLLPGLGDVSVTLSAAVSAASETLVVLGRLPSQVQASPLASLTATSGPLWSTTRPIVLERLTGKGYSVAVGVQADMGLKPPIDTDELGIELSIGASAGLAGQGTLIMLGDVLPGAYPSPSEPGLDLQSQLEPQLQDLLGQSKKDAKAEIEAWIESRTINQLNGGGASPQLTLSDTGKQKLATLLTTAAGSALDKALAPIGATVKLPIISQLVSKWTSTSSSTLVSRLLLLRQQIATSSDPNVSANDKALDLAKIDAYVLLLRRFQARVSSDTTTDFRTRLCRFWLLSMAGTIEATQAATASMSANVLAVQAPEVLADFSGGGLAVDFNASAQELARATGKVQLITSRYQSYVEGNGTGPLIVTRDTSISYRGITLGVDASVNANVQAGDFGISAGTQAPPLGWEYRSMTYRAIVSSWIYPAAAVVASVEVRPTSGSGVVFGLSADVMRLARAAAKLTPSNYLRGIARQLRVPLDELVSFLSEAQLGELAQTDTTGNPLPAAVFLEASFTFDDTVRLRAKLASSSTSAAVYELDDPLRSPTVQTFMKGLQTTTSVSPMLQALRLRVRIGDVVASSNDLFVLGFNVAGSGFSIEVRELSGAGHEGFFDLYVRWYGNDALNTDPSKAVVAQDRAIPPVAFMHVESRHVEASA